MLRAIIAIQTTTFVVAGFYFLSQGQRHFGAAQLLLAAVNWILYA